jgi:hypothetical protein
MLTYILRQPQKHDSKKVMKQYVIDELRPGEYEKIKIWLDENFGRSAVDGIYWIPLEPKYLTAEQAEHKSCQPHCFAVALEQHQLACEFLVRTPTRIRCSCMGYADETQCVQIIRFAEELFKTLNIRI